MSNLTRTVTKDECHWLDADLPAGLEVHVYSGCTYSCVGAGIAVTLAKGKTPFFEIPRDALAVPRADRSTARDEQTSPWVPVTEPCSHPTCEFPSCDCEWHPPADRGVGS